MTSRHAAHSRGREERCFMRHPAAIPIVCRCLGHSSAVPSGLLNASLGGLSFLSRGVFVTEDIVDVSFPGRIVTAPFSVVVVWRHEVDGDKANRHAYGGRFCDAEMFPRARLLEQICHIEAYRKTQAERCNRHLTSNQAAEEWIARYGSRFP